MLKEMRLGNFGIGSNGAIGKLGGQRLMSKWSESAVLQSIKSPTSEAYETQIHAPEITFIGAQKQPDFATADITFYPEKEVIEGHAQVRVVFGMRRKGSVAGCQVSDGVLKRGALIRVLRGGEPVHVGPMASLRRFKDDVREVASGYECGVGVEGFSDFQENDVLESFRMSTGK